MHRWAKIVSDIEENFEVLKLYSWIVLSWLTILCGLFTFPHNLFLNVLSKIVFKVQIAYKVQIA